MEKKTRIQTRKEEFTVDYPEACDFMERQASVFWPHFEVKVEKDKQDILVNMTESERHGVITVLKLFTQYELNINDYWLLRVNKKFPRPADIMPMATLFGAMENAVHAKFYSKINDELGLTHDPNFYNEYKESDVMRQRIEWLDSVASDEDDLRSLGAFTFSEGAILYSSFAFLKHFQSLGKNKLLNIVSGINFSARDEALHAEASAWLFRTLMQEKLDAGLIDEEYCKNLEKQLREAAHKVLDHEVEIIQEVFSKGRIEGITEGQLKNFVKSRINMCLRNLGYTNEFEVKSNPVGEWFYAGINGYQMQDFFSSQGNQYSRDWNSNDFQFVSKGD